MQNNIVDFANEAVSVNTKLINKSIELGVKSTQDFVDSVSKQTGELMKVKTFDDYTAAQESWSAFVVEQSTKAAKSMTNFGSESFGEYLGLWNKYAKDVAVTAVPAVANGSAKKA